MRQRQKLRELVLIRPAIFMGIHRERGQSKKDLATGSGDQGGLSRDLLRGNLATGHALVEGCAQGPAPVLTPEENLLQDLHHHLLLGKEQGLSGKMLLNHRFFNQSNSPGNQVGLSNQAGKGRRLPGGIRSSSSPGR